MAQYIVILKNPSNGYPIPLMDFDDELIVYNSPEDLEKEECPLFKMGCYEVFEIGTGKTIEEIIQK
ncbi:hypothetical protein [Methanococcus maripaludis]|uniref:Uncharacterized protein n=1 Tax=Methanococcus maripaludis TaxID=39152 RepID=A0A7J9PQ61_METMI|nr:hypothetical protein [Methanococcus maripaludis]MBA2864924.1 hypothetical protein [Methanococcus maripaludis]